MRHALTDKLRKLARWLDGRDDGRLHRLAVTAMNQYIGRTERYIADLESYIERQNTCVVCKCNLLIPKNAPPHCEDTCHPDEDQHEAWEGAHLADPVGELRKKHGRFDTRPLIEQGAWS